MATPIMTIELAADGNSVFVYRGGLDTNETDFTGAPEDSRILEACIGLQREDAAFQVAEYVRKAVESL